MLISQFDNDTPASSDEDGLSECTVEHCCYAGIQTVNKSNVDLYCCTKCRTQRSSLDLCNACVNKGRHGRYTAYLALTGM